MSITPVADTAYFANVGKSILDSAADALECNGVDVPDRMFVGFNRPPQDVCPELVLWISNIRTWDGNFPDTRTDTRLLCLNAYAFDATIRIGRCYVDVDEHGQPLDTATLEDFSAELYKDVTALYMGWVNQWRGGNVSELNSYEAVTVSQCTPYSEGGCAGWEFTVTVGTI